MAWSIGQNAESSPLSCSGVLGHLGQGVFLIPEATFFSLLNGIGVFRSNLWVPASAWRSCSSPPPVCSPLWPSTYSADSRWLLSSPKSIKTLELGFRGTSHLCLNASACFVLFWHTWIRDFPHCSVRCYIGHFGACVCALLYKLVISLLLNSGVSLDADLLTLFWQVVWFWLLFSGAVWKNQSWVVVLLPRLFCLYRMLIRTSLCIMNMFSWILV